MFEESQVVRSVAPPDSVMFVVPDHPAAISGDAPRSNVGNEFVEPLGANAELSGDLTPHFVQVKS